MSAEIINLSARRRPAEPSGGVSMRSDPSKVRVWLACLDYLQASAQVEAFREAAVKLGWDAPKDDREATHKMAAMMILLGTQMAEAIPHFTPDLARDEPPGTRPDRRRSRSKPKPGR